MEKTKKIGIDARFFGPKDKGFGRYVENLIENLEIIDKVNQYFIFLNEERAKEYVPGNPNFRKILINYGSLWPFKTDKRMGDWELDVMHFTCLPPPLFYNRKFILTMHDMTWRIFPPFKNSPKRLIYSIVFKRAIERAEKIISVSEYTKKDILKFYKINPQKIEVIYEGVS